MSSRSLPRIVPAPVRNVVCMLTTASLLLLVMPVAAAGQTSQAAWYVNDNPRLEGPAESWYTGQAGEGYGSNNYRYTYAIGDAAQPDNSAVWEMGQRVGRQEVQAFIPCNHAVATVTYEIRAGSASYRSEVRQFDECGHRAWTSLGRFETDGQTVTITLADNASRQHHDRDGYFWSSFGADAIRMRCVSRCGNEARTPSVPTGLSYSVEPYEAQANRVLITLEWQAATSPAANEYHIAYSRGAQSWTFTSPTSRHQVIAPPDVNYNIAVSARNSAGTSRAARTTVSTSPREAPSQSFWNDVGNPSVGQSRLLDLYREAADLQCSSGPIQWNHIASVAMQESTHGQTQHRTSDVLPPSTGNEEFDVRPQITPRGSVRGPMQIQPSVWEQDIWGSGGGFRAKVPPGLRATGYGTNQAFPDINNMKAAAHGAAAFLCHLAGIAGEEGGVGHGTELVDPAMCAFAFYYSGPGKCVEKLHRTNDPNNPTIRDYAEEVQARSQRYIGAGTVTVGQHPSGARVSDADPQDYPHGFGGCVSDADSWNMVQRQCTSYVAWRLNDAGIPFHNTSYDNNGSGLLPHSCTSWCGHKWGHAAQWDEAALAVGIAVDGNPSRGAVAQWTGSLYGHVAYVERVSNNGDTIVISDSNGGGTCGLRPSVTLNRGDPGWPDNFIHFEATR